MTQGFIGICSDINSWVSFYSCIEAIHTSYVTEDHGKEKKPGQLPAYKWAEIYRGLRTFLRPFGDSGEGRLDFYHRSLSKAVRIK